MYITAVNPLKLKPHSAPFPMASSDVYWKIPPIAFTFWYQEMILKPHFQSNKKIKISKWERILDF